MYIFENVYLYWIYAANNMGSMCQLNIYVGIGYIMPTLVVQKSENHPKIRKSSKNLKIFQKLSKNLRVGPGRPKDLVVRGLVCPGTCMSERPGSPKGLDVRGLDRPGTWMSERPGCPGTWMSGDLDVRDLSVRKLSVRELNVREPLGQIKILYMKNMKFDDLSK